MTDKAYSLGNPSLTNIDEQRFLEIFSEYSDSLARMHRREYPPTIHEFVQSILKVLINLRHFDYTSAIRVFTDMNFTVSIATKILNKLVELKVLVPSEQ